MCNHALSKLINSQLIRKSALLLVSFILFPSLLSAQQQNSYLEYTGSWEEGVGYSIDIMDQMAAIGSGSILKLYDITDDEQSVELSSLKSKGLITDILLDQDLAFLSINNIGLQIIDISNVQAPVSISFTEITGWFPLIAKKDHNLFYSIHKILYTIDISDPFNPEIKNNHEVLNSFHTIKVDGDLIYGGKGYYGYYIIEISDPENPITLFESENSDDYINDVLLKDQIAYLISYDSLYILDISDLQDVEILQSEYFDSGIYLDFIHEDTLIVMGSYSTASFYDISDPINPNLLAENIKSGQGQIQRWRRNTHSVHGISELGKMVNFHFSDLNNSVFFVDTVAIGYTYKSYLLDDMIMLNNKSSGGRLFSIEDPKNPVFIDNTLQDNISIYAQIHENHLYSVSGVLKVFDLTDPMVPVELGQTALSENGYIRNSLIKDGFLYLADYSNGLFIIDISEPTNPLEISFFDPEGETVGVDVIGNLVYLACNDAGIRVLDISDPSNPYEISALEEIGKCSDVKVVGDAAYVSRYNSKSIILDVSDPYNPELIDGHLNRNVNHILVDDIFAFVSGTSTGIRVYNISNELEPVLLDSYLTPGQVYHSSYDGEYLYLADYYCGLQILRFDKTSHTLEPVQLPGISVTIFPNPTSLVEKINIKSNTHDLLECTIQIYDQIGNKVFSSSKRSLYQGKTIVLPIDASLSPGIYNISIQGKDYLYTDQIIMH